jgi:hypothetical protein
MKQTSTKSSSFSLEIILDFLLFNISRVHIINVCNDDYEGIYGWFVVHKNFRHVRGMKIPETFKFNCKMMQYFSTPFIKKIRRRFFSITRVFLLESLFCSKTPEKKLCSWFFHLFVIQEGLNDNFNSIKNFSCFRFLILFSSLPISEWIVKLET